MLKQSSHGTLPIKPGKVTTFVYNTLKYPYIIYQKTNHSTTNSSQAVTKL